MNGDEAEDVATSPHHESIKDALTNPRIVDKRDLKTKWFCENNDQAFRAEAPSTCPYCGADLSMEKYHETHYRELRYYREDE